MSAGQEDQSLCEMGKGVISSQSSKNGMEPFHRIDMDTLLSEDRDEARLAIIKSLG